MSKIAFIGAGSIVFTRNLVRDILTFPAFDDVEIALMDIDTEKLAVMKQVVERIIQAGNHNASVWTTTERAEAIDHADGIVITIAVGSQAVVYRDIDIPMKYGVDICVGDTRGPAGIFRFLRTLPVLLEICADIERLAPDAIVLNYTNPMAMLCRALQEKTKLQITGLCHSVQGTAEMLARWIGAPIDEITYTCAGVNHQAFYIDYRWNGKDAYPLIRQAMEDPAILNEEQVRNDLFLHFGYYVTESSGHASEYCAWYRKRKDLLEQYCTHGTGWNPGQHRMFDVYAKDWRTEFQEWMDHPIDLQHGHEYASFIFNAVFGDQTMVEFNGNVRNFGLIDNLPEGVCVEIPMTASKNGFRSCHVGKLPPQLAILNTQTALCEELAVEGFFARSKEMIYHAIAMDPLTASVCSLEEIKQMVEELFEVHADYLPDFK